MGMFRIFLASDVHASDIVFRKFANSGQYYKVNALVLAGDITGKALVLVVQRKDGTYEANFLGVRETARNETELASILQKLANRGYYYRVVRENEFSEISGNEELLKKMILEEMVSRAEEWMNLLQKTIGGKGISAYILIGNDDPREVSEVVRRHSDGNVHSIDESTFQFENGMEGLGMPYSNITPWHLPGDLPEEELGRKIEALAGRLADPARSIFVIHVPPKDTVLDVAPKLEDLRIKADMSGIKMDHVGSTAVRSCIEQYQPTASFHGHIHESRGTCTIGRTRCFNAGSEYEQGILRGALINLDGNPPRVRGYMLVSG